MALFQSGVIPAWEDEVNKAGGEIQINFKSTLKALQPIWNKLVYSVTGGSFENADQIAGIRLLDKSTNGRESNFRIEVWTKFNSQKSELVDQLKKHLESEYVKTLIDDPDTSPSNKQIDQSNPADWLKGFSNHESSSDC